MRKLHYGDLSMRAPCSFVVAEDLFVEKRS